MTGFINFYTADGTLNHTEDATESILIILGYTNIFPEEKVRVTYIIKAASTDREISSLLPELHITEGDVFLNYTAE